MDTLIARAQEANDLKDLLSYLDAHKSQLRANKAVILNAVQALDPARHSLAYLYLLESKASGNVPGQDLLPFIDASSRFLEACAADQIQLAQDKMVSLCRTFKDCCITAGHPRRAVLPLLAGLRKLQPSRTCLTPIHADFCQVCLLAKVYRAALDVLQDDVLDVEPSKTGMRPTDLLLYSLYGGMICAGSVDALPKYVSNTTQRGIKSNCEPYNALATGFNGKSPEELATLVNTHTALYQQDRNLGLVQQVLVAHRKRSVHKLTQTYLTLSVQDIATHINAASADDAELYIFRMVDSGDIHARISEHEGGMVHFLEPPEQYSSMAVVQHVQALVDSSVHLAERLCTANHLVSCDSAYLNKTSVSERHRRYEDQDFGSEQDLQSLAFKP